jgi:type VI protein secretion system component Hcp
MGQPGPPGENCSGPPPAPGPQSVGVVHIDGNGFDPARGLAVFGASGGVTFADVAPGGAGGKPVLEHFILHKGIDGFSPALLGAALTGQILNSVRVDILRSDGSTALRYVLTNSFVLELQSTHSDGPLTESVTLNFEKFEVSYVPQSGGGQGGDVEGGYCWDKKQDKPC